MKGSQRRLSWRVFSWVRLRLPPLFPASKANLQTLEPSRCPVENHPRKGLPPQKQKKASSFGVKSKRCKINGLTWYLRHFFSLGLPKRAVLGHLLAESFRRDPQPELRAPGSRRSRAASFSITWRRSGGFMRLPQNRWWLHQTCSFLFLFRPSGFSALGCFDRAS